MQCRVDLLVVSILLSFAVLLFPSLASAQAGQASVVGQVNDKSSALGGGPRTMNYSILTERP